MNKHNKRISKIGALVVFLGSLIGCGPHNNPVLNDPETPDDMTSQSHPTVDMASGQPADLGQAPRTNCLSAAPKLNEECCWVWCEDQTVNIQTGTWHINRENGDFFCDLNPNKTSYDCSSTQLRCDDRNGGCVR
jgi:hypothetical protein